MSPSRSRPTSLQPPTPTRPRTSHSGHRPPAPLHIQIPSLHSDAFPLTTHLHVPNYSSTIPFCRRAAVIAHPYAPLGGSLHDPVVQRLAQTLLSCGFIVAVFNFRGAGGGHGRDKGRTSWTGRAEQGDYAAIASWVLAFVRALPRPLTPLEEESGGERRGESTPNSRDDDEEEEKDKDIQLVLGGYSYGSIIAASCPPVSELMAAHDSPPSKAFGTAIQAAGKIARRWHDSHSIAARTSYSGVRPISSHDLPPVVCHSPAPSEFTVREVLVWYLLISPVLPPISTFLMLPFPGKSSKDSKTVLDLATAKERAKGLLAVYGDDDMFTGVKKYQKWVAGMKEGWPEGFGAVEVEDATHFWGDEELTEVERRVVEWVSNF